MIHVDATKTVQSARMSEMDRFMERLEKALVEARKRVTSLEDLLRALERAREKLPSDILESTIATLTPDFGRTLVEPQRIRGNLPPQDVANLARDTLLKVGRPLKRGHLVKELQKRDVPLAGADKNKNLGTVLWRHRNLFVSLPKLGYWARGVPLPGVYDPETYVESDSNLSDK